MTQFGINVIYNKLQYLEKANKWLNEVELKLKTTENIPGGAEEISEVLSVSSELV